MTKSFKGYIDDDETIVDVVVDGRSSKLPLHLEIVNHSPTGFNWGYGGSGPAQLALAILVDLKGEKFALRYYQDFKTEVIAGLKMDQPFTLTEDEIKAWIAKKMQIETPTPDHHRERCLCGKFGIGDYYAAAVYPFSHQIARISPLGRYAYNEDGASAHDCAGEDEKWRQVKELI